ncbi:MAG: glycosyltransferase [Ignavibacteria bacterium]|nr:glycosyltransferase [Ignavibacteria bacterium]
MYNSNAIFVSPSHIEGFPLPPAEAMCCGCAVIASDIGGHREYCEDGKNSLLFEPGNQKVLEKKISFMINENSIRFNLAKSGHENILKYKWETSFKNSRIF